uniref:CBM1 domain-containing protein n=1 Tax=Tetradesmus obliquus TaxID=3088 RepID=A0A383W658_TETOB|eukprot:jgi/Sobl393_1/13358/SZX66592.1
MPGSPDMTGGVPGQPTTPTPGQMPANMTMHNVASTGKVPLPEFMQCGGAGGLCDVFGECADRVWATRSCGTGLTCNKQNKWYYQCLKSSSTTPPTKPPTPPPASGNVLARWAQCGGTGGACASSATGGKCVDGPFPGTSCASGSKCARQSVYY